MNLVLTIAMGPYAELGKLTHPSIQAYAAKIGAAFLCISERKIAETTPHWEKFQISELLDIYDRILYVDTDIIIRDDCPNIFDIVPDDCLGAFDEGKFTARSKEMMIDVCKQYDTTMASWDGRYFNTGVLVISQCHKELFIKPQKEIFNFYEQSYLNMMIAKMKIKVFEIDYKLNRMTCMDMFTGEKRHASYIIHYAGCPNLSTVFQLVPLDLMEWKNRDESITQRHIHIVVNGGLGDQICAEPAIRWMIENHYPTDDVIISSHWPRIFEHLKGIAKVYVQGGAKFDNDTPYFTKQTLPGPDTLQWAIVSHLLCHSVDYTSMSLLKRTLKYQDKQIRFVVLEDDFSKLRRISRVEDFNGYVAIHPGRHWESKTMPKWWWQGIIDGLHQAGVKMVFIGKDEPGDPPDYKAGARGTVDVDVPEGVLDLRNLIDLGTLGALLSEATVLVSNDSAPVHLAGAFDNWIVLFPTCKDPDHILPFRNGSIFYKTKALCKRLIIDDIESRPTQVYETSADIHVEDWTRYLTEPKLVVEEILEIIGK